MEIQFSLSKGPAISLVRGNTTGVSFAVSKGISATVSPVATISVTTISDVNITNVQDDDILQYNASSGFWENVPLEHIPDDNNVTQQVKNVSGGQLLKGTPVHAVTDASPQGQLAYVIAARADTASAMPATFVLNEDLNDEAEGEALVVGLISGIDTSAFTAGDVVYVGETGGYTNVKPTGTNLIQNLGVVIKSHASSGSGIVYGSGRSNDVPNLPDGKFFIGSSTNTQASVYTLPTSDGTSGQALITDGSGSVTFGDVASQDFLGEAIEVFLPDGGNFGKFSHTDTIAIGDGTKTALDIIREALIQLGEIQAPSISANPSNVRHANHQRDGSDYSHGNKPKRIPRLHHYLQVL